MKVEGFGLFNCEFSVPLFNGVTITIRDWFKIYNNYNLIKVQMIEDSKSNLYIFSYVVCFMFPDSDYLMDLQTFLCFLHSFFFMSDNFIYINY